MYYYAIYSGFFFSKYYIICLYKICALVAFRIAKYYFFSHTDIEFGKQLSVQLHLTRPYPVFNKCSVAAEISLLWSITFS